MRKYILFLCIGMSAYAMDNHEPNSTVQYKALCKDICTIIAKKTGSCAYEQKKLVKDLPWHRVHPSGNWNNLQIINQKFLCELVYARLSNPANGTSSDHFKIGYKFIDAPLNASEIFFDGPNSPSEGVALVSYLHHYISDTRGGDYHAQRVLGLLKISSEEFQPRAASSSSFFRAALTSINDSPNQEITAVALASHSHFATTQKNGYLNIYRYFMNQGQVIIQMPSMQKQLSPPQDYYVQLAWIYGKTLLAKTRSGKLDIITINGEQVNVHPQKIPFNVKQFAVHNPDANHEIILSDKDQTLYYANLAHIKDGKIPYRVIYKRPVKKIGTPQEHYFLNNQLAKNRSDKESKINWPSKLWFFNNRIGILNADCEQCHIFGFAQEPEEVNLCMQALKERT